MIRSIAYELFDRLTTDPEALRKQLSNARADRDAVAIELADYQTGLRTAPNDACTQCQEQLSLVQQQFATYRDRLQTIVDEQLGPQETLGFAELLTRVEDGLRKGSRAEAQLLLQRDKSDLTIEPTWILALWSIHAEGWTEDKRGSYDSMLGEMRKTAMPWQLFPRSQWDALAKNGRAR